MVSPFARTSQARFAFDYCNAKAQGDAKVGFEVRPLLFRTGPCFAVGQQAKLKSSCCVLNFSQ
jgi:hypothetical protein